MNDLGRPTRNAVDRACQDLAHAAAEEAPARHEDQEHGMPTLLGLPIIRQKRMNTALPVNTDTARDARGDGVDVPRLFQGRSWYLKDNSVNFATCV